MKIHMRTTLIALALLAVGVVPPASAKDTPRHTHAAMNARAQIPAAKPIAGRAPTSYVDANGRLHDPDMDWETRKRGNARLVVNDNVSPSRGASQPSLRRLRLLWRPSNPAISWLDCFGGRVQRFLEQRHRYARGRKRRSSRKLVAPLRT